MHRDGLCDHGGGASISLGIRAGFQTIARTRRCASIRPRALRFGPVPFDLLDYGCVPARDLQTFKSPGQRAHSGCTVLPQVLRQRPVHSPGRYG